MRASCTPIRLTRGLAAALGAAPAPATPEAPAPTVREREREATGDRVFVLGLGATAASALVLALVVNTGGWAKPVAPPVSAQLDAIRQAAEREGSATVFASVEDLHGVSSHVFVLAPRDGPLPPSCESTTRTMVGCACGSASGRRAQGTDELLVSMRIRARQPT